MDTLTACIGIYCDMLPEIRFRPEAMEQAASKGYLDATDLADYLVARGLAFREAHHLVGEAVSFALARKKELHQLSLEQLQTFSDLIGDDVFSFLQTRQMVERRTSWGGTAGKNVRLAIAAAETKLEGRI